MRITTLWGERKGYEDASPELMVAWDEHSIDYNGEEFARECEQAIASWGDELVQWRRIDIVVPDAAIFKAFESVYVKGRVVT